jgi:hypothetical protein
LMQKPDFGQAFLWEERWRHLKADYVLLNDTRG